MNFVEIVGYAASLLVALSLMMSNIWRLRWINLLGSIIFSVYGAWVGAYPVMAVNSFIACVNIYYIVQLSKRKDYFSYIELRNSDDILLGKFLKFYEKDIKKFFPDFSIDKLQNPRYHIIFRNLIPVGLFIYQMRQTEGIIEVALDYVIPDYRDLKNANFIHSEKAKQLQNSGYHVFIANSPVKVHQDYLKKIGYVQDKDDKNLFRKEIISYASNS